MMTGYEIKELAKDVILGMKAAGLDIGKISSLQVTINVAAGGGAKIVIGENTEHPEHPK